MVAIQVSCKHDKNAAAAAAARFKSSIKRDKDDEFKSSWRQQTY